MALVIFVLDVVNATATKLGLDLTLVMLILDNAIVILESKGWRVTNACQISTDIRIEDALVMKKNYDLKKDFF